jgi:site-specific DNA-methyltransferase (adenine-specific)
MDADCLDPPYLIRTDGGGHFRKARPQFDAIADQDLDKDFDLAILNPLLCGAVVVFASNDQLGRVIPHLDGNFERYALCTWQKTNPTPIANKSYRSDCEFYIHAWSRGFHPTGDVGERLRVRRFSSPRGPDRHGHPTPKPEPLMASIMVNLAGQTVCDPFMGSGTTGVAAIRAGKVFTGIEHNPQHFETAARRIEAAWRATQQEAA